MTHHGLGNLDNLFQQAQQDGLSDDALDLIISNLNGPTMTQPVGQSLSQLASTDVTLAMNIIDMSGSMGPHAADLRRAYNEDYLQAMRASPAADDILVSTILFDNQIELLHGYVGLEDAAELDVRNYGPRGATAVYDAVASGLTNMVLYSEQLRQSGITVRCVVIVYSDGDDNSSQQKPQKIKQTVQELLRQEMYTFAYVGFLDASARPLGFKTGTQANPVQKLANKIGFQEALVAGLSPTALRRLFYMASQSTVMVSRNGAAMANTAVFSHS